METLAKSDAFFFITSIAVIVLTIALLIALYYIVRFARNAVSVSKRIKEESENISNDIAALRAKVSEEGVGIRALFKLFGGFFGNTLGKRKKTRPTKADKSGSKED
jgi:hypothetical protein